MRYVGKAYEAVLYGMAGFAGFLMVAMMTTIFIDVDNGGDGQQALAGKKRHGAGNRIGSAILNSIAGPVQVCYTLLAPVEPNPAFPREVLSSSVTSCRAMRATCATTSCATRMPRMTVKGSLPWLIRST